MVSPNRQLAWRACLERLRSAPPGVPPWLIRLYRQDPRFTDLAAQSQQAYDYHLRMCSLSYACCDLAARSV